MAKRRIFKVCQNCPGRKLRENPENYILIPKEKLKEDIRYLELKLLSYGNNDVPIRGVYAGKLTALKELLRKNEG